jgi:hypothetical protein
MSERIGKLFGIEDDLAETVVDGRKKDWIEQWSDQGVEELEAYLANWQTFAVKSIVKAQRSRDSEELASWGLSEDDVADWDSRQLAA